MAQDDKAKDPYRYFRIEAREIIDALGSGVLALEKAGSTSDAIANLLRLAHTIKGAARIVKQREIADLAHQIEDRLEPLRAHDAPPSRHDEVLALIDRMASHLAALPPPDRPPAASTTLPKPRVEDVPLPRADSSAIDSLIAGLTDLNAQILRLRNAPSLDALGPHVDRLDRDLRQLRLDAERLRLMPASSAFAALERTARDASLGDKQVAFVGVGGDVRLDAAVLAGIHGALVQLVRNAVAHGIETPARRRAAGKPAGGTVTLEVRLRGTRATFTCSDDGAGIDLVAVRRAAEARDATLASISDDDLLAVLLQGGLTTTTQVTEIAGRGIGLDVVRDAARKLGGEVTASSTPGQGTAIAITVPVSLASLPAMIVEAGGQVAAIPLHAVRRVERVAESAVIRTSEGLAMAFDDVTIAFDSLARLLGSRARGPVRTAVIVRAGDTLVALAVDQLRGVDDIVVRAVPEAPIDAIVLGVMLDADGLPRPVLDPVVMVAAATRAAAPADAVASEPRTILVVDDSLTTRMLEQSILESAGYVVETASSAEEGLDKASSKAYALFLVDVEMPGMDGFGFVSEVRRRPALSATPAIMVTSRASADDRARGAAAGANGFMAKGEFDQVELLAMIRRLVTP